MYIQHLTPEMQEKAKNELNEIPSQVPIFMQELRDWIKEHPEYHCRTGDLWLLNFLRGCKFNLEKTKSKLEYFHKVRITAPKFYVNRDPLLADIQNLFKSGLLIPVVKDEHVNLIVRFKNVDPKKVPLNLMMRGGAMLMEMFINENKYCMVSGFHLIIDYSGFSYSYLPQVTPDFVRKVISTLQNAYPLRVRGIHLINTPTILDALISFTKPLITKQFSRFYVYKEEKLHNLFEIVPKSIVPIEYGGDGQKIDEITSYWKDRIESYRDWFLEENQYYSNTTKTPEIKALQENFRKLELD